MADEGGIRTRVIDELELFANWSDVQSLIGKALEFWWVMVNHLLGMLRPLCVSVAKSMVSWERDRACWVMSSSRRLLSDVDGGLEMVKLDQLLKHPAKAGFIVSSYKAIFHL
jgi:hypothetical protein